MIRSPEVLAARREALVAHTTELRQNMSEDFAALAAPLDRLNQAALQAKPLLRYAPVVVGIGVAILVWKKPRGLLNAGGKLLSAWRYCTPLVSLLKYIRPRQDQTTEGF